jgi:hypothetical protein
VLLALVLLALVAHALRYRGGVKARP